MRYFKDKEYRWELNARYNYWANQHQWQTVAILCGPYIFIALNSFAFNSFWPAVIALSWVPIMIYFLMLRQNDVMEKFKYPHDDYGVRNYFTNKWLRRDSNRFVYFDKIDNFRADAHTYNIERTLFDIVLPGNDWNPYGVIKNVMIHDWWMSGSRLATTQEIEKYNLASYEAKILLSHKLP